MASLKGRSSRNVQSLHMVRPVVHHQELLEQEQHQGPLEGKQHQDHLEGKQHQDHLEQELHQDHLEREQPLIDLHDPLDDSNIENDMRRIDNLNTIKETDLPLYSMTCNGQLVSVLLDTGASTSYISPRVCSHVTLEQVTGREVETAGGHQIGIHSRASFELGIVNGCVIPWRAYVLDTKFDLILGQDWFKSVEPIPHWHHDSWQIKHQDKTFTLLPSRKRVIPDLAYLITQRQVERYTRKKEISEMFLLFTASNRTSSTNVNNKAFKSMIEEYRDVFRDSLPGLPPVRQVEHVIDTGDAEPINKPPFKMSPRELDELRKQLAELLELGLIRPSASPWGAPVLFVRKKDGSMRLCIDYRAINQVTKRNGHPLPRIDECLERLNGARFFTSIDLKSGYHQVRIREEDVPKTAFNTRYGSYEFLVLPFGLTNAPPTFQRLMNSILGEYLDKCVLVYLDDILVFSRTQEDHIKHVRQLLECLRKAQLYANLKKCEFNKQELEFVGFHVSDQGILPSKSKVAAVQSWPVPTNVQEVRQFLGLASHYRRFIKNFANIAAPLTDLTHGNGHKRRSIEWSNRCQEAFDRIKTCMSSAPILVAPDPDKPFVVETDACDYGVGAVLSQEGDDGLMHPVAFESKKLSPAERTYPAQERELLGILHALRTWRCFIDGRPYVVYTDHHPLRYFRTQSKPTARLTRWVAELELYDPEIRYKPGKENHVPDILSRRDGPQCTTTASDMEPAYLYTVTSVQESDWPKFYAFPEERRPEMLRDLLYKHKDKFVVRDNMVFRLVKEGDSTREVRFARFSVRADLVDSFHRGFGHAAGKNIVHLVKRHYWWPNMEQDIKEWVASCPQCQLADKANRDAHHAPMHLTDIPPPFSRWHLDFIGELPTTTKGNKWILVAVDYATSWPITRAMPEATGEAIANFLYEEIVMRFGCPHEIVTDRGPNFQSKVLANYIARIKLRHVFTSAYHPRSNGKCERTNGILKQMLRKYVNGAVNHWDQYLDTALFAARIRKHRTTEMSPFYMVYGQDPVLPGDPLKPFIVRDFSDTSPESLKDARLPSLRRLRDARAIAKARTSKDRQADKDRWDFHMQHHVYKVGDLVLMRHENRVNLELNWKGPYRVVACNHDTDTYQLVDMWNKPYDSWVHTDRLKPVHTSSKPSQPWYDPTASRADNRHQVPFSRPNAKHDWIEDDQ